MNHRPQDAKNKFYKKLRIDEETRETIKWFNRIKYIMIRKLKNG